MKLFVGVALFAFVAVQLSSSAPTADEDKKEATAVVPPAPGAAPAAPAAPEVKSAAPEPAPSPSPETVPAEEKKA